MHECSESEIGTIVAVNSEIRLKSSCYCRIDFLLLFDIRVERVKPVEDTILFDLLKEVKRDEISSF